ncbi:MAG: hypothetical protein QGI46_08350 [Planctomycetota bacterium]|jgi:hypothetical protein|nr:hypothetical protein [Planctomycetota bacterium]
MPVGRFVVRTDDLPEGFDFQGESQVSMEVRAGETSVLHLSK